MGKVAWGQIKIPLDDHVGRAVFFFGDLDPKLTWVVRRLVQPGDTALDIGANFGLITLLLARLVGPRGFVHAFEPNPIVSDVLKETLAYNNLTNIRLHRVALGQACGEMTLHVPKGNFGAGSLVRKKGGANDVHAVSIMPLDEVVAREGITKIALIKIDVEGFELEVLKGAQRVLSELRPDAILFESNDMPQDGSTTTPVMEFLKECGYEFLTIPRCLVWMRTKILHVENSHELHGHDIIAARRGEAFARMRWLLRAR